MPARTAACRMRCHRTEWSAWRRSLSRLSLKGGRNHLTTPAPGRKPESRLSPQAWGASCKSGGLFLGGSLDRVLDGVECREFDVVQFTVLLLDLAHVDVLDDVA